MRDRIRTAPGGHRLSPGPHTAAGPKRRFTARHRRDAPITEQQARPLDGYRRPVRVLIIGADPTGQALAKELTEHFPHDYEIVGFVDHDRVQAEAADGTVLGGREEIANLVRDHQIDQVMIADFLVGKLGGVRTAVPAVLAPGSSEECEASSWLDRQLADRSGPELPPPEGRSKRALDLSIALAALVLGAPCAALAALAVRLTSPGPILYRQERVGRNGRPFTIYKFRSMVQDAEEHTGPVLARRGDSRSTIVGRLLRASKIDEWPQFYNVLRGDMSVVGPRPERPCFVQNYCRHIPTYSQRHTVRPGITGLAQVNGRYLSHVYVKLHYDLLYVYNRTLWLDLLILARTPLAILCNLKGHN